MESLPVPRLRRGLPAERRVLLETATRVSLNSSAATNWDDLADVMVENAFGTFCVPLGVVPNCLVDGRLVHIALATEEPSVVAAASYATALISKEGGFSTDFTEPITSAYVYVEGVDATGLAELRERTESLADELRPLFGAMEARGGGPRGVTVDSLSDGTVRVGIRVDVRDAMGANAVNSAAEHLRGPIERISGGVVLMAILTNASTERLASASFRIPVARLSRAANTGAENARRIVRANEIADLDTERAVTHNKGIMNGVSGLALATGNDTRAVAAAIHAWASRTGRYRPLTEYRIQADALVGRIRLPVPFATVGGAVSIHPVARDALHLMGDPDSGFLSRCAAALGLAQNFAALFALVSEGIQGGHMRLHARRLAYMAGATVRTETESP